MSAYEIPSNININPTIVISDFDAVPMVTVPEADFSGLVKHIRLLKSAIEAKDALIQRHNDRNAEVTRIAAEFATSIEENEIEDADEQVFSVNDINRLLCAMNLEEIQVQQEFEFEVTVTVTTTVTRKGWDIDSLRDELENELGNIDFEDGFNHLDSEFEVGYVQTDVSVESNY